MKSFYSISLVVATLIRFYTYLLSITPWRCFCGIRVSYTDIFFCAFLQSAGGFYFCPMIVPPLRQICLYSPLIEVGVLPTERTKSHFVTLCAPVWARKCIFYSTRVASSRSVLIYRKVELSYILKKPRHLYQMSGSYFLIKYYWSVFYTFVS